MIDLAQTFSYAVMQTPVGELLIAEENGAICVLSFQAGQHPVEPAPRWREGSPLLDEAQKQLREYFSRRRRTFDLPLAPRGTDFQRAAWRALQQIPYGETRSYGEQARMIGNPRAARAVGAANARNPISIIIPCHRVIGATGHLTGFGGGIEIKEELIAFERGQKTVDAMLATR